MAGHVERAVNKTYGICDNPHEVHGESLIDLHLGLVEYEFPW